jgi:peptidoglycan-associated lipoprotein
MFRRAGILLLALVLVLTFAGCGAMGGSGKAGTGGAGAGAGLLESDLDSQREGRFADGSIPLAEGDGLFRDVRFAFNSSLIDDSGRHALEYNAHVLRENSQIKVVLEGHCDERGTREYNMALGARRAQAVFDMLLSYGISPDRLTTISYGAELPLDPASNEAAWAKNRRVHFSGYSGPLR